MDLNCKFFGGRVMERGSLTETSSTIQIHNSGISACSFLKCGFELWVYNLINSLLGGCSSAALPACLGGLAMWARRLRQGRSGLDPRSAWVGSCQRGVENQDL